MMANGANDRLVGKNLLEIKDQNGKPFVKEYLAMAQAKGSGWTDYDWVHPQTKKIEAKASYVRKLDGVDAVVGVGVYR
jgi:signal transduction histidine kinase